MKTINLDDIELKNIRGGNIVFVGEMGTFREIETPDKEPAKTIDLPAGAPFTQILLNEGIAPE